MTSVLKRDDRVDHPALPVPYITILGSLGLKAASGFAVPVRIAEKK
jgi:hypothetical protein